MATTNEIWQSKITRVPILERVQLTILALVTSLISYLTFFHNRDLAFLLIPYVMAWLGILTGDRRSVWLAIGSMTALTFLLLLSIGLLTLIGLIALASWWFLRASRLGLGLFTGTDLLWDAIGLGATICGLILVF